MALIRVLACCCSMALFALASPVAWPEDVPTFKLVAREGKWFPETVEVPANTRFRLEITNQNAGPEEFETKELRKELVLAPGVSRVLVFAPLKPGTYPFVGEFHPKTAHGRIVAK
ncbi:MAG: cupredoxin domain-containing protein [Betaproteobacteria bacterium]|nr:cupredoxin domain-containing protein [Betaproteobacteria bacterium]MBI2959107.1 cupredoxin domain-containing protein [Betaproteobacteria bacterium]